MTQHLQIDQIIDPSDATVIVRRDANGRLLDASFDLSGLPRVDAMMVGRPVADVPALAERLCGICPVAHHLAGVAALEALYGPVTLTPTAKAVRALLNYGSVIDSHLLGFVAQDLDAVKVLRRFARLAMAAAGSPKHFPTTAVPGGVAKAVGLEDLAAVQDAMDEVRRVAQGLVLAHLNDESVSGAFVGADVALITPNGQLDLMGERLRASAADGAMIVDGAVPSQWDAIVRETTAGSAAPRPYLTELGPKDGKYRTGPVAQLRVGRLATPLAAAAQQQWLAGGARATAARAIIVLHCVEAIGRLCETPQLTLDDLGEPLQMSKAGGTGVGWIETGRGLLVHRYVASSSGAVVSAQILTPTAQNEPWLAELLRQACDNPDTELAMEDAIREADPCLPCSTAPRGQMGLVVNIKTMPPEVASAAPTIKQTAEFEFTGASGPWSGAFGFVAPSGIGSNSQADFGFTGHPADRVGTSSLETEFGGPCDTGSTCFLGDASPRSQASPPAAPSQPSMS